MHDVVFYVKIFSNNDSKEVEKIMKDKQKIGKIIRQKRLLLGITQQELSEKVGYKARTSINRIENGIVEVPDSKLGKFAEVLNCTIGDLLSEPIDELSLQQKETMFVTTAKDAIVNISQDSKFKGTSMEAIDAVLQSAIALKDRELRDKIQKIEHYYDMFYIYLERALKLPKEQQDKLLIEAFKNVDSLILGDCNEDDLILFMRKYDL